MIGASLWGNNILNGADGFRNMGEKKQKRTAIYCRVSTTRQEMVHCSQSRTISESTIEKAVLKAVKAEVDKITIEQSKPRQNGAQRATAAKEKAIQRKLERLKAAYLNGAIPLDEYKMDRERLTEELTALKASEPRKTAPAVRLYKVFTSDFETVYKALNASERRRLRRSVIKEIRTDAGKNLDIIFL